MTAREGPREDLDVAALTVAMIVAPGVYARNRMFAFFAAPVAGHARTRARLVRSLIVQMSRARSGVTDLQLDGGGEDTAGWRLRFAIPAMSFNRTLVLTAEELAALRFVLSRGESLRVPHPALAATDADRVLVDAVLKKLA